eukprot:12937371-Prorocentrum_lima.AAC.1
MVALMIAQGGGLWGATVSGLHRECDAGCCRVADKSDVLCDDGGLRRRGCYRANGEWDHGVWAE